jgi:hypothetical protein
MPVKQNSSHILESCWNSLFSFTAFWPSPVTLASLMGGFVLCREDPWGGVYPFTGTVVYRMGAGLHCTVLLYSSGAMGAACITLPGGSLNIAR